MKCTIDESNKQCTEKYHLTELSLETLVPNDHIHVLHRISLQSANFVTSNQHQHRQCMNDTNLRRQNCWSACSNDTFCAVFIMCNQNQESQYQKQMFRSLDLAWTSKEHHHHLCYVLIHFSPLGTLSSLACSVWSMEKERLLAFRTAKFCWPRAKLVLAAAAAPCANCFCNRPGVERRLRLENQ